MRIKVCNLYTIVRSLHIVEFIRILKAKENIVFRLFTCLFKPLNADFLQNLALFDIVFLLILIFAKSDGIEIIFIRKHAFNTRGVTRRQLFAVVIVLVFNAVFR